MFSDEILLVQAVVDQINATAVSTQQTLQEYLLYIRTIVTPFVGACKTKWAIKSDSEMLQSPKGKVLMAIIFAAVQAKYPQFDDRIDCAIERFLTNNGTPYRIKWSLFLLSVEGYDVMNALDSIQLLPYIMRILHNRVDERIIDIVDKVSAQSSGIDGIFPAIQHAVSENIISRFTSFSVNQELMERIELMTRQSFIENRFKSLFELMAMLPDSEPAFLELAVVLRNTPSCDLNDLLQWTLESCRAKLLSPAIPTDTIVGQFVHGAKMFKLLDPTGLLLDRTSGMAREYLMERRPQELHECCFKLLNVLLELDHNNNQQPTPIHFDIKHEEYLLFYYQPDLIDDWFPDPPAAGKTPIRYSSKSFNPLAILANFSDQANLLDCLHKSVAKQLMSGGLNGMSSGKLLKRIGWFANVLLGKAACTKLLVMLHDAQVSKDLFASMKSPDCTPLVISKSYWPVNGKSTSNITATFPNMDQFNQEFTVAKPKRHLQWLPELSTVDMDLKIDEIVFAMNGVPFMAYSLMQRLCDSKSSLSLSSLDDHEKEGTMYWLERGFCHIDNQNNIKLCKPGTTPICDLASLSAHLFDTQQTQTQSSSSHHPKQDKIAPHNVTMVVSMLTNLGPMPAARIHAMLVAMGGLKGVEVGEVTEWLISRPEVQYDPVTGVFCRQTK